MTRLIDLLLEGPRFKPEAVRQETAKAQDRNVRLPAVVMTLVLLSNLPAIPYFLWVGVRDWVSFGLLVTCIFTLLGLQLYTLLATRVGPMTRIASSAVAAVAVAVTSHMYGPLILTPLLLIGCVVTPSVDPNRRVRVHGLIFTLLA